jgi:hypothetical protein
MGYLDISSGLAAQHLLKIVQFAFIIVDELCAPCLED